MAGRPRASDPKVALSLSVLTSTVNYFTEKAKDKDQTTARYIGEMLDRTAAARQAEEPPPIGASPPRRETPIPAVKSKPGDCKHPMWARSKGFCYQCGQMVKEK